ncbi:hypothetical protein H5410_035785 [Solanum commersonii]|uniref:tRNA pseudouridine synthase n=1 Tax=Solanum commersonii TaxID=4109 RepID=A0A9J5Y2A2_SOLCO|nr:hypothetical protein H5410_035785 [Solanum commersonii]
MGPFCVAIPLIAFSSVPFDKALMVRVLVATAIREAAAGADDDALLKLMDATCRRATAPPAPPDGLCLVDVGYTDYDIRHCLIP